MLAKAGAPWVLMPEPIAKNQPRLVFFMGVLEAAILRDARMNLALFS